MENGLKTRGISISNEVTNVDETSLRITHLINTKTLDRYGTVVLPKAAMVEKFLQNPVVLWLHNSDMAIPQIPIAKCVSIDIRENEIEVVTEFNKNDVLAIKVFNAYKDGFLKAWSIGFIPMSFKEITVENLAWINQTYNLQLNLTEADFNSPGGLWVIDKWELLEYSAVPVPGNPDALSADKADSFKRELVTRGLFAKEAVDTLKVSVKEFECECLSCGEVVKSDKHCKDIKCPKCGGDMRRKDRPSKDEVKKEAPQETVVEEKSETVVVEPVVEAVVEAPVIEEKAVVSVEEVKVEETVVEKAIETAPEAVVPQPEKSEAEVTPEPVKDEEAISPVPPTAENTNVPTESLSALAEKLVAEALKVERDENSKRLEVLTQGNADLLKRLADMETKLQEAVANLEPDNIDKVRVLEQKRLANCPNTFFSNLLKSN